MKKCFQKFFPALLIICFFSYSIPLNATTLCRVVCEESKALLSDMVAFPEVINDASDNYDESEKEELSKKCVELFDEWKEINFKRPGSVKLNNVRVVPITDSLVISQLNPQFQECFQFVVESNERPDSKLEYALCYEYTSRNLFGGKNYNRAFCIVGSIEDSFYSTPIDTLEASDSTIAAAAIVNYSGADSIYIEYE